MGRAILLVLAVAIGSSAIGACGPDETGGARPFEATATTATTFRKVTLLESCVANVVYWVPKVLSGDGASQYGDYQTMGLSGGEYEALREALDTLRTDPSRPVGPLAQQTCSTKKLTAGWS